MRKIEYNYVLEIKPPSTEKLLIATIGAKSSSFEITSVNIIRIYVFISPAPRSSLVGSAISQSVIMIKYIQVNILPSTE